MKHAARISILFIMTAAMISCTKVKFGAPEDMPDSVDISFKFDWQDQTAPDEMCVVMSRIINTVHYGWLVDPSGSVKENINPVPDTPDTDGSGTDGGTGTDGTNTDDGSETGGTDTAGGTETGDGNTTEGSASEAGPAAEEENTPEAKDEAGTDSDAPAAESPETADMNVQNGEYYVMAFNRDISAFTVGGLDEFISDPACSMKDIRLAARKYTHEEFEAEYGTEMTDFNPRYEFIRTIVPVYIEVKEVQLSPAHPAEITITPAPLTQEITFRVRMKIEDGVEIQDVSAEISGLAGSVEIMSGQIDDTETFRSIFKMTEVSANGADRIYEGKLLTFGLFPSKDLAFITGPGILQLSIRASDGENTKVFHAGINIKETISSARLLEKLENDRYRITAGTAVLEIPNTLSIAKDQVAPGDDHGVEIWVDSDSNKIDAEI